MGWVGLGQSFGGLGWVEEIRPLDNSGRMDSWLVDVRDME